MFGARLTPNQKPRIRGVGAVRVTGGLIDQSLIPARSPSRRVLADRAARQLTQPDTEPSEYAALIQAWQAAERGPAKRAALTTLRAHEQRHGRLPYKPAIAVQPRTVDVSTGAESWLERK